MSVWEHKFKPEKVSLCAYHQMRTKQDYIPGNEETISNWFDHKWDTIRGRY